MVQWNQSRTMVCEHHSQKDAVDMVHVNQSQTMVCEHHSQKDAVDMVHVNQSWTMVCEHHSQRDAVDMVHVNQSQCQSSWCTRTIPGLHNVVPENQSEQGSTKMVRQNHFSAIALR
jgi:hypothetical protein